MRGDHRVAQLPDLVDGEARGGVRVDHGRGADQPGIAVHGGPDGQLGGADVGAVQGRALRREVADADRVGAESRRGRVGTSTAKPSGRLVIRPWFATFAWMTRGGAGLQRVDHLRRVLGGVRLGLEAARAASCSRTRVVLGEVLGADADVVADRDPQPLDLARVVEVPRHVLAGVLAGLGRVEAEPAVHVDAHPAAQLGVGGDPLVEQRVQALARRAPSAAPSAWWLTPGRQ